MMQVIVLCRSMLPASEPVLEPDGGHFSLFRAINPFT